MPYSELATYLAHRRQLTANEDFSLAMNAALTAFEAGNTVIRNPFPVKEELLAHHLITETAEGAPLTVQGDYLWLTRVYQWEKSLADDIKRRINAPPLVIPPFAAEKNLTAEQSAAIYLALKNHLTIINGGPGTGKTYTVSQIVRAVLEYEPQTRIAFAAPTGKAAKRMEESLKQNPVFKTLPEAQTLHRLLGLNRGKNPLYHREQPLPVDLLIVDEASMLSLELASVLFAACPLEARLILLGDADQLAAVDAGAVLHDLSHHPVVQPFIATLTKTHRFDSQSGIGRLALSLQQKTLTQIRPYLTQQNNIFWQEKTGSDIYHQLFAPYQALIGELKRSQLDPAACFAAFDQYRILCAGHAGRLGCERVNQELSALHLQALQQPTGSNAYHGMPILITANNYDLGLFNGDIGLCLLGERGAQVYFPEREQTVPLSALSPLQRMPAYALTVHKSQGSEYARVALLMDESNEKLLTRELLYTGLTRARENIDLYASETVLQTAVERSTERQTGLFTIL